MQQPHDGSIHLHRVDAALNMRRFYTADLQPTLFGSISIIRNWGRIGTSGREKIETFDTEEAARLAFDRLISAKRRRGYEAPTDKTGGGLAVAKA